MPTASVPSTNLVAPSADSVNALLDLLNGASSALLITVKASNRALCTACDAAWAPESLQNSIPGLLSCTSAALAREEDSKLPRESSILHVVQICEFGPSLALLPT